MRRLALGLCALALVVSQSIGVGPGGQSRVQAQQGGPAPGTPAPGTPAAAPAPLRVAVDLGCEVEGAAEAPDSFQYYVWERLNKFGLRVDSVRPVGDARLDAYVSAAAAKWSEKQAAQGPATLQITGRSVCDYANAAFFDQTQAHTY